MSSLEIDNMDNIAIKTENLVKRFGKFTAIDNLNVTIPKEKIYGFLGPNGAGKTTAINLFMDIVKPTSGKITVLNHDPTSRDRFKLRKKIGFMPQDVSLYEDLTPMEQCMFFGRLNGLSKAEAKKSAMELLEFFDLKEKMNTQLHALSGGMKRRTSLTVALVHHPELVILDEPTVGVDPVLRRDLWNYFRDLNKSEKRVTFLITTHVFDEVDRMDEILLLYRGKLIEQGSPNALKEKYNVKSLEDIFLNVVDNDGSTKLNGEEH